MRVVGVDPGCLGALALLHDGVLIEVLDMPCVSVRRGKSDKREIDAYSLTAALRRWSPDIVIIEQVGGMPGQAAGASFNFGRAAGAPEYVAAALDLRVERVHPATWKKRLGVRGDKDNSRIAAMRLWPGKSALFQRKKDDGRAESALVGHWYNLQNGGSDGVFG